MDLWFVVVDHRRLDIKQRQDSVPDANQSITDRQGKHTNEPNNTKGHRDANGVEKHLYEKRLKEIVKEESKKPREAENNQPEKKQKHEPDHLKDIREREESKKVNGWKPKEESRPERLMNKFPDQPVGNAYKEKSAGVQKPIFERSEEAPLSNIL